MTTWQPTTDTDLIASKADQGLYPWTQEHAKALASARQAIGFSCREAAKELGWHYWQWVSHLEARLEDRQ